MFKLQNVKYKNILNISSLNINSKKITSIVGESGSGKTTLLRLLNKMISSDSGDIFYNNEPIKNIKSTSLRRKVVMLPQTPVIYDSTIKDNLLIGLKFSEKPQVDDKKLLDILKMVHLNKSLNDNSSTLSGGEKQRLALGRVLLLTPEVLLLDEPSSSLDSETEKIIITTLVKYTKENNKSLIMVTHSNDVAKNFSDEIITLLKGEVVNKEVL